MAALTLADPLERRVRPRERAWRDECGKLPFFGPGITCARKKDRQAHRKLYDRPPDAPA
jgi:hypothetical protein